MFFVTFSSLWSFVIFFILTYFTLVISIINYILPVISFNTKYNFSRTKINSNFLTGLDVFYVSITPYVLFFLLNLLWVSPSFSVWFGHIIITSFQVKITYFLILSYLMISYIFFNNVYFSSRELYDYVIVTFNFCYWVLLLFFVNSIFTTIFVIEVISTLILLLIITSTFSTAYFYRNIDLSFGHITQQIIPYTYIQSILYFFWVSLISSLNLFLFFLFFYIKLFTLDWYLTEYIFLYYIYLVSYKDLISLGLSWLIMLFCIFLKCGIAPLFIWKPTFFKGIPIYTLFFYICFFYFFLFLFIIHFLTSYFNEIFYFYSSLTILIVVFGLLTLLCIMCESFYLKIFLAISSILNSLFVIMALSTSHNIHFYFWI